MCVCVAEGPRAACMCSLRQFSPTVHCTPELGVALLFIRICRFARRCFPPCGQADGWYFASVDAACSSSQKPILTAECRFRIGPRKWGASLLLQHSPSSSVRPYPRSRGRARRSIRQSILSQDSMQHGRVNSDERTLSLSPNARHWMGGFSGNRGKHAEQHNTVTR